MSETDPGADMCALANDDDAARSERTELSRRDVLQLAVGAVALVATTGQAAAGALVGDSLDAEPSALHLTINSQARDLAVDPRQSILDVLRETLQLTGTKKGCNQGACGACTVLLNGQRVNSCLTLAVMHDGAEITTIEGLAQGEDLHPLQAAFIEHEAFQCGYCTSGQIMSGIGCISEGHAHSPDEIRFWMSGNICRCGAYPGIVAAVADAGART